MLVRLTQNDVVHRRFLDPTHRAYVPDFGVVMKVNGKDNMPEYRVLSRQLVLFCVERRKAWRLLQSKVGLENKDYRAQRELLGDVAADRISKAELFERGHELIEELIAGPVQEAV